jgi:hypothetical protein
MKRFRPTPTNWLIVVGTILAFAVVFVIAMALYGATDLPWRNLRAIASLALLFATLGAYYGTIAALDGESDIASADRPFLRTLICSALGATAVLLVQTWPPQSFDTQWVVVGAAGGGLFGWIGWAWAKYVDF